MFPSISASYTKSFQIVRIWYSSERQIEKSCIHGFKRHKSRSLALSVAICEKVDNVMERKTWYIQVNLTNCIKWRQYQVPTDQFRHELGIWCCILHYQRPITYHSAFSIYIWLFYKLLFVANKINVSKWKWCIFQSHIGYIPIS